MTTASPMTSSPAEFDTLVVLAQHEHNARRLAEAATAYRKIIALRPDVAEPYNNLGNVLVEQGQFDEAAIQYQRALAINPSLFQAYNNLGNILREQGRLDQAVVRYEQALALRPDLAEVHNSLGTVLKDLGKTDQAIARYEQALALRPDYVAVLLNLANILEELGKLDQAIARYEQAIALRPGRAMAYNNLGNVLVKLGRREEAAVQFERAVSLRPGLFQAHVTLGCIYQEQSQFERAAASFQRAIALRPDRAIGHSTLGYVRLEQGKTEEAKAAFERALALQPDLYEAHNSLGCILEQLGLADQAIACFARALAINPHYPAAHNNLGHALKDLGRFEEAAAHFDEALALRPDFAEAHFNRSELKTFRAGDVDLAALEAIAADPSRLTPAKMTHIHFALGKALEDVGEYDRAFEHLLQGNALKRSQVDYDTKTCAETLRRVKKMFDADFLDRFRGVGDPSAAPIFILGMPRSGSTLVEQILAGHPQVHAAGELWSLHRAVEESKDSAGETIPFPDSIASLDADGFRRLGQAYLATLPALVDGKTRITDKMPGNFLRIGLIRLILPNARIIHTVRDPVETCVSCFAKLFSTGLAYTYDLAELGAFYRMYQDLMAHWRTVLPAGSILDVAYEDVVDNLEEQARRMIDFCGLPWDDRCLSFHKHRRPITTASNFQVRQPLYRSSLARWRRYEAHLQPLLAELEGGQQSI